MWVMMICCWKTMKLSFSALLCLYCVFDGFKIRSYAIDTSEKSNFKNFTCSSKCFASSIFLATTTEYCGGQRARFPCANTIKSSIDIIEVLWIIDEYIDEYILQWIKWNKSEWKFVRMKIWRNCEYWINQIIERISQIPEVIFNRNVTECSDCQR